MNSDVTPEAMTYVSTFHDARCSPKSQVPVNNDVTPEAMTYMSTFHDARCGS